VFASKLVVKRHKVGEARSLASRVDMIDPVKFHRHRFSTCEGHRKQSPVGAKIIPPQCDTRTKMLSVNGGSSGSFNQRQPPILRMSMVCPNKAFPPQLRPMSECTLKDWPITFGSFHFWEFQAMAIASLSRGEFASLQEVARGKDQSAIPQDHKTRLYALSLTHHLFGRPSITVAGRLRLARGM
jgi:hypothetical protein